MGPVEDFLDIRKCLFTLPNLRVEMSCILKDDFLESPQIHLRFF